MKRMLCTAAVIGAFTPPAFCSDLKTEMPVKAPAVAPAPPFTWTSCYLGAHGGGGWGHKTVDFSQIVALSTGVSSASIDVSGYIVGGQFGCDYQPASSWVVGIEGAVSGGDIKGNTTVLAVFGNPGDSTITTARTDFLPSITGRLGYAWDRWLIYLKGGAAWAGDKYTAAGVFQRTLVNFEGVDTHIGWTAGAGIEWAFSSNWSARLEYDYYGFEHRAVILTDTPLGISGPADIKQNIQVVKLGVSFHVWGTPAPLP
jgi:outer membrane immunogenic protein